MSESSRTFDVDQDVSTLFPLDTDDMGDRSSWTWCDAVVVEVSEDYRTGVEYALQVVDARAGAPHELVFRDPSEVRPRPATQPEVVRVVVEATDGDGDGLATVEAVASIEEYGEQILLVITGGGMSVTAGLSVVGSRSLRAALTDAEELIERSAS